MSHSDLVTSYQASSRVETVSIKLDGIIVLLEILAEQDMTSRSSAIYAVTDMLEQQKEELDLLTHELMQTYRHQIGK
jgi:hypothetical protein